jgi:g-D-glutamyl-meso-diaminopimelate peptidase
VDLNLQYPAMWEAAREIKFAQGFTGPAPRDYVGTAPLSAPESRALAAYTRQEDPDLILAYHTQGNVIYWRFLDLAPEGARELGLRLARVSGYALEDAPFASGYAGYKDWFIQSFDRPGYTVEAGLGENPLPLSRFEEIWTANVPLLTAAALG